MHYLQRYTVSSLKICGVMYQWIRHKSWIRLSNVCPLSVSAAWKEDTKRDIAWTMHFSQDTDLIDGQSASLSLYHTYPLKPSNWTTFTRPTFQVTLRLLILPKVCNVNRVKLLMRQLACLTILQSLPSTYISNFHPGGILDLKPDHTSMSHLVVDLLTNHHAMEIKAHAYISLLLPRLIKLPSPLE